MSTLRVNNLTNQANDGGIEFAVQPVIDGLAKAWVNFDGTGTVAIRASYNVSSITDLGTGIYYVNFIEAMPDTNYSIVSSCRNAGITVAFSSSAIQGVSQGFVNTQYPVNTNYDVNVVSVAVFR